MNKISVKKSVNLWSLVSVTVCVLILSSCGPDEKKDIVYPKGKSLYYADYTKPAVGVVDVNVLGSSTLIADGSKGLDTVASIAVDFVGGKIYAAEELKNRIIRFNVDGSGTVEVLYDAADSVDTPTAITFHSSTNSLYWSNSGTSQIKRGTMDGSTDAASLRFNTVDSVINYSYGLKVDSKNEYIYYSDLIETGGAGIWRGKVDGTANRQAMFYSGSTNSTVLRNPSSIALDEDKLNIYWADEGLKVISVGSYSTFASAVIYNYADGVTRADGIALDLGNSQIYWTETTENNSTGRIMRASLDGQGTPEVVLGGVVSYSIALGF